ncbi:ribulose-phosphate 3-epimerase [Marvinbryantia sp.]|uniref:ribulose-phosphate 3-epimerase n=1 Tax=Marvinbryantia sp. TaxID=2496532 RepID=UPI0025DD32C0|nr:hypothetical protein [uncultured Marvinbryantia sp.]
MLKQNGFMPSVMCSNMRSLERDMVFYQEQFSYLHIDVCDGHFCPNIAAGPDIANTLREIAPMQMDYHFMTTDPERIIPLFDIRRGDQVSIQIESLSAPSVLIRKLHDKGADVLLALKPATPLSGLEYLWQHIDGINVMMIEPGYGKQNAQEEMFRKIADVRDEAVRRGFGGMKIQVDGNVSMQHVRKMKKNGANQFVLGTSALFTDGYIDVKKYSEFTEVFAEK